MSRPLYLVLAPLCAISFLDAAQAQTILTCSETSVPPVLRSEGVTERTGDIVLVCNGGSPGAAITGNFSVFFPVNITNRLAGNGSNQVTDVAFTVDNGSGPRPVNVPGVITGPGTLVYNGLSFMLSSTGAATLRLANVRAAANQLPALPNNSIQALIGFNSGSLLSMPLNQFNVGTPLRGLYTGFSSKLICGPRGSALSDNAASLASFLASNAVFNSTRVTEGFPDAFSPRSGFENLNADTGTRILVRYSGFPSGARLFVPNVIAGSDALAPTAGGDFGLPASGGRYARTENGSLLLARVQGTDAKGAGGLPVYSPGVVGSGTVSFDGVTEVSLANGAGIVVYEVMDANEHVQESAQFPTFLGLASFEGTAVQTAEDVSFAPVSTVFTASATDPIPRFQQMTPAPDCTIVGDCGANYFPRLSVPESSLQYTAQAGSNFKVDYIQVQNTAGGVMRWSTSVKYLNGADWLRLSPDAGLNNSTIRVDAIPGTLAAGTYKAILTIDGGALAGSRDIPITLTITAAPAPTVDPPSIRSAVNAATFAAGPLAPGSIATLMGEKLSGSGLSVSFDGVPGQVLFSNDTQINVLVPATLGSKTTAQVTVQSHGMSSAPQTVTLAPFAPGIFSNGVLDQDYSVNGIEHPAPLGTIIQIFATGLSGQGVIFAKIGERVIEQPYYGGPAPELIGVQQVNLILPKDLTGSTANVSVCGGVTRDQAVCSPAVRVVIVE